MTEDAWLLVSWIVVGALVLFLQVALVWTVARSPTLNLAWKLLGLLPPVTPAVAWVAGARTGALLWLLLVVVYAVLRLA